MGPCHSCAPDSTPGRGLGMHHPREGWKRTAWCSRRSRSLLNCRSALRSRLYCISCPTIWPQALLWEQALQNKALPRSSFQPVGQWERTCISLPCSISWVTSLGQKNSDAVVLYRHTGKGQSRRWPVPTWQTQHPETSSLPSRLVPQWAFGVIFEMLLFSFRNLAVVQASYLVLGWAIFSCFPCFVKQLLACVTPIPQHLAESCSCRWAFRSLWALSQNRVHSLIVFDRFWKNSQYCTLSLCILYNFGLFWFNSGVNFFHFPLLLNRLDICKHFCYLISLASKEWIQFPISLFGNSILP